MKITKPAPAFTYLSELDVGDVFWLDGYGYYMKTETKGTCNAINLCYGEFIECGDNCEVQKVDCELVIH